jgi:hypothetical protein
LSTFFAVADDVAHSYTTNLLLFAALRQVTIWVRRAGPNYQEGLNLMRQCAYSTGLEIHIYGPETHATAVVPLALGLANRWDFPEFDDPRNLTFTGYEHRRVASEYSSFGFSFRAAG